jgi:F5/8 type C domain/Domain of unknown function (DUF5668)
MTSKEERARLRNRQSRVSSATWGMLFMVMGTLFMLDSLGKIDMAQSSRLTWQHPASHAVDGDPETRWSSAFRDPQWLTVDLGTVAEITKVRLRWESAYAKDYEIEVSNDESAWTTLKSVTDGDGEIDEFDVAATGRYVRVRGTRRATPYGYSLYEFEVYGKPGLMTASPPLDGTSPMILLSQGMVATASSLEGPSHFVRYWMLYWPVLMIGSGLPLLLAPKDGGEQVIGVVLSGVGVLLQLQSLALVTWTFSQVWPVLLVVAGFLLVTQAFREMNRPPRGSDPPTGNDADRTGGFR